MPDPLENLYRIKKPDILKAGSVLENAFQLDPVWKKMLEDIPGADEKLPAFYETPVRYCFKFGEIYAASRNLEGVAAWVPGELSVMTPWRLIRSGAMKSARKLGFKLGRKMKIVFKPVERDRKEHMEGRSYIYVFILGVATEFQGLGFGGKLIRAMIGKSEQDGLPLYLETETEKNVALYEKFGFKMLKKTILPLIDLPMWEMVREPKNGGYIQRNLYSWYWGGSSALFSSSYSCSVFFPATGSHPFCFL